MGENLWHGYPQHPDSHPERPWWRERRNGEWTRADGLVVYIAQTEEDVVWRALTSGFVSSEIIGTTDEMTSSEAMARIDREHPLPAPEPRCGQVWVHKHWATMIARIERNRPHFGHVWDSRGASTEAAAPWGWVGTWPPPGAVLVAGHGAPWAPMGEGDRE